MNLQDPDVPSVVSRIPKITVEKETLRPQTRVGPTHVGICLGFAAQPISITTLLILFTSAVCYFRLFIFPSVPIVPGGDALGFASAGSRIVAGQLPYRDFFEILPPGIDLTYAALIKWFGLWTWIPGMVMICLAAAIVMVMTLITMRLIRGAATALPGLLFAGLILLESLDGTHHWFSTLAVIAAMLVLLSGAGYRRIAVAGALCGLAACFTQTKGAMATAGFLAYIVWKSRREGAPGYRWWRKCVLLCGVVAGVFASVNAYFIRAAGLSRWWFCLVTFPLRYYSVPAINNWRVIEHDFHWNPGLARWIAFPFVYSTIPLVYIIFVIAMRRRWKKEHVETWDHLVLVLLTGVAMFLAIAPSPSVKRLSTVSPPAMILLAWLVNMPGKTTRRLKTGLAALAVAVAVAAPIHTQARNWACLELPAGRTALPDAAQYEEYRWVLRHTQPGQYFFGMPPLYLPFHMRNPTAIEGFDFSKYTRPEQVAAALQALKKHNVPLIILPPGYERHFAAVFKSDRLSPFWDYLRQNYRRTKTFQDGDEAWERID